jgi:GT2 family glycosyltransferase
MRASRLSIVIPTFQREGVLVETIRRVLALRPSELLLCDQTPRHEPATEKALYEWEERGEIQILRISQPNIARAMNLGVLKASGEIVLFLDDDVIPSPGLLAAHEAAYAGHAEAWAVVGQVLQPGEEPAGTGRGTDFRFYSTEAQWIDKAIACNFSVKRDRFLEVGGFDENFVQVAYCFETEFAERVIQSGGKVFFEPGASIRHLRAERGGTRAHGHHLTTASSAHSVGAYYHLFLRHGVIGAIPGAANRLVTSVATRHHLKRPWWIPVTLFGEVRGLAKAGQLFRTGQRLLKP